MMLSNLCKAISIGILLAFGGNASAQTSLDQTIHDSGLPGADLAYPLQARDLEVERALQLYARNLGIGLRIDGTVDGTITEALPSNLNRLEYLDELALRYDFLWYFDGLILIVSDLENLETEVFAMQSNTGAGVINMLKRLGIYRSRFQHMLDPRRNAFLVSGPTAYVERVRKAVKAMEEADRGDITVLRGSNNNITSGASVGAAVTTPSATGAGTPSATSAASTSSP